MVLIYHVWNGQNGQLFQKNFKNIFGSFCVIRSWSAFRSLKKYFKKVLTSRHDYDIIILQGDDDAAHKIKGGIYYGKINDCGKCDRRTIFN